GRDPHGVREGQPRGLGRGGQARARALRDGRRQPRRGQGGDAAGGGQAAHQDPLPGLDGGGEVKTEELRTLDADELEGKVKDARGPEEGPCPQGGGRGQRWLRSSRRRAAATARCGWVGWSRTRWTRRSSYRSPTSSLIPSTRRSSSTV